MSNHCRRCTRLFKSSWANTAKSPSRLNHSHFHCIFLCILCIDIFFKLENVYWNYFNMSIGFKIDKKKTIPPTFIMLSKNDGSGEFDRKVKLNHGRRLLEGLISQQRRKRCNWILSEIKPNSSRLLITKIESTNLLYLFSIITTHFHTFLI